MSGDVILKPQEWISFLNCHLDSEKYIKLFKYQFQLNTGARFNEMMNVKLKDIKFEDKNILLRVTKKRTPFSDGSPRLIPISSIFMKNLYSFVVKNKLENNQYLFNISQAGYNQFLKQKLREIGFEKWNEFSSHNLRKTLETWLASLDVGTLKILKHFGHFQSTAVKHYVQIDCFSYQEKMMIREILGDLYLNNSGEINLLNKRIDLLGKRFKELRKFVRKDDIKNLDNIREEVEYVV
jgi:hypothetical protein